MIYLNKSLLLAVLTVALLTACGQSTTDTASSAPQPTSLTASSTQPIQVTESSPLLQSLAAVYPNGQLPAANAAQAAKELTQNPAALKLTAQSAPITAQSAAQNTGAPIQAQATSADYKAVTRIQNTTLTGAYFFTIYDTERASALAGNPNWKLEGPAFWASLASGTGLNPVHRFRNNLNGSYLYTIYEAEKADIQANYAATFFYEGVAWYAQQTPGAGWSPLYRFRNLLNGTYLFSAYEAEKDAIVANFSAVFKLEGVAYYVRQDAPLSLSVSLFAGNWANGLSGITDGQGSSARFYNATAMSSDSLGNLFVADTYNNTIRKISSNGLVSTFAGSAPTGAFVVPCSETSSCGSDGVGLSATFNMPQGIALDGANNVYVSDTNNHTIRKITPAGVVTTLAGAVGVAGSSDGTGLAASFSSPKGLSVDAAGNVYVVDSGNHTIRMINTSGVVSTLAGAAGSAGNLDGSGSAARFNDPTGIVCGDANTLWITDTGNHTVRKINRTDNSVSTVAGAASTSGYQDGVRAAAQFASPKGIARDAANNLFVADFNNHSIRKITSAGVVSTVVGRGPNWTCRCENALPAPSYQPVNVHVVGGNLFFISDDAILKINGLP